MGKGKIGSSSNRILYMSPDKPKTFKKRKIKEIKMTPEIFQRAINNKIKRLEIYINKKENLNSPLYLEYLNQLNFLKMKHLK